MTYEISTSPDGTRWLVITKSDFTTKRERIDPLLFPPPQLKPLPESELPF